MTDERNVPMEDLTLESAYLSDLLADVADHYISELHADVLALPLATVCGAACRDVIQQAEAFIALLPDQTEQHSNIRDIACQQCAVIFFG